MTAFPCFQETIYDGSRCFFTYGTMAHINLEQPPSKGKLWTTLAAQEFVYKADIIAPRDCAEALQEALLKRRPPPQFARVTMSLAHILEGPFFTEYIKVGNIMMISEGRSRLDNVYTLRDGKLAMYLGRETYERAGLVGKPQGQGGRRNPTPRWVVEYDLRSPSMFRGKKGFDRLMHACKTVLDTPVAWLFCNVTTKSPNPDPLDAYLPIKSTCLPEVSMNIGVSSPSLTPPSLLIAEGDRASLDTFASGVYEWLSLIRLQSPRVHSDDDIDPYLSRYQVPDQRNQGQEEKLCRITWEGFLSPSWIRTTLIEAILDLPPRSWFSFSVTSFAKGMAEGYRDCTVLRLPQCPAEHMLWEVRSTHE